MVITRGKSRQTDDDIALPHEAKVASTEDMLPSSSGVEVLESVVLTLLISRSSLLVAGEAHVMSCWGKSSPTVAAILQESRRSAQHSTQAGGCWTAFSAWSRTSNSKQCGSFLAMRQAGRKQGFKKRKIIKQ